MSKDIVKTLHGTKSNDLACLYISIVRYILIV
jgi:hypothetical protein